VLHEPELLLLDEPFSGLDDSAHDVVGELMAETAARGGCVVFTEHRPDVAESYASTLYRLADGTLSTFAAPDEDGPRVRIVLTGASASEWTTEPGSSG
jgi:ABC-2 type transport system ATP-binding protein